MKKRRNYVFLIIIIIIILTSIRINDFVMATNTQKTKKEIQEKISQVKEEKEEIQLELSSALQQVSELNRKIISYESEISKLDSEFQGLQTEINDAEIKLNVLEKNSFKQKKVLENRVVAQYEAGETKYLDVLLNSNNLSEFVSNYFLISEIAQYDTGLLNNIEKEKNEIKILKNALIEQRESIKAIKTSKEKAQISLENTKAIKNQYAKQLTEEELLIKKYLEELQEELKNVAYSGGEFLWPVPSSSIITSLYGNRMHPTLHYWRFHNGVDIGAPEGTKVIAAFGGKVTTVGWTEGGRWIYSNCSKW